MFLLNAWGLRLFGRGVDYSRFGDVGEWVSGLGTLAAFVAAIFAIRVEQRRDATEDFQRRTSIYAWLRYVDDGPVPDGWHLYLANACSAPVYLWRLAINGVGHLGATDLGPLPPGITERRLDIDILRAFAVDADSISVWFLDSEGRGWTRQGARTAVAKPIDEVVRFCSEAPPR
jgi:hypothetical protein